MTLGSLFDGSGTALLAAAMCGITPVWASEVEPYPIAVTHTHFPDVLHLGDVTQINGAEIPPVDVIVFGSPCQDMSVAGKRAGMQHTEHGGEETTRSGLFYEAVRIIKEMRGATDGECPAFIVWENVPGAFSSNDGEDFRCVLEEVANATGGGHTIPRPAGGAWKPVGLCVGDDFSIAWRVLDAQYWGVPQRRRRIYLVADFGGRRAGEILFERDGLQGYIAQGGEARTETSGDAGGSASGSGRRIYSIHDKASRYRGGGATRHDDGSANGLGISDDGTMYTLDTGCRHSVIYPSIARALTAEADTSPCMDRGQNFVVALGCRNLVGNREISGTLQAKSNGGQSLNYINPICYTQSKFSEYVPSVGTLTAMNTENITRSSGNIVCMATGQANAETDDKICPTLMHGNERPMICFKHKRKYIVRRLTPTECARLQGFPDNWGKPKRIRDLTDEEADFWNKVRATAFRIAGKRAAPLPKGKLKNWINGLHSDTAEYKMWGNGMALPCLLYVIQGIREVC